MLAHEDDCEKMLYGGGSCTCDLIREYGADAMDDAATAAGEARELAEPGEGDLDG